MAWIESHQTLKDHPKLIFLMNHLKVTRASAVGHLHLLWWWCVDYAMDGVIRYEPPVIAQAADWPGDPVTFVDALVSCNLLDRSDQGELMIHDWFEFCGSLIVKRLERRGSKRQTISAERLPNGRLPTQPNQPNPTNHLVRFDRFWQTYPKKVGKGKARAWWLKHQPSEALAQTMLAAVRRDVDTAQWRKDGGQFIPHPATWLHQSRWEDTPPVPAETRPAYDRPWQDMAPC